MFDMMRQPPSRMREFKQAYRAYPFSKLQGPARKELDYGGKIILPPSALERLSTLHIAYPMLFHLKSQKHYTHAGVLEFIAAEGHIYLPQWMFKVLQINPGDLLTVNTTNLPLGKFVKIQPQSTSFLQITDPKAVLEYAFRSFTTLTRGDIFSISYNDSIYDILVLEVKPESDKFGISIIETDLEVDFEAPLGYVEPTPIQRNTSIEEHTVKDDIFVPLTGSGHTLKGKSVVVNDSEKDSAAALRLPFGKLFFGYPVVPLKGKNSENGKDIPFTGNGFSLRSGK